MPGPMRIRFGTMTRKKMKKYYFAGIGGSGMSALAQVLRGKGHAVSGSDRSFDRGLNRRLFTKLQKQGIRLFPQTGEKISGDTDFLIISTAIEKSSPELKKAKMLGIPVRHRAELLAALFNRSAGIGIAGTSGKSTVCGMVAAVMDRAGMDPAVINGGIIKQYVSLTALGNAKGGSSAHMVSEVDESDGTIVNFTPDIGVITNISRDHKELRELKMLFSQFGEKTKKCLIVNGDCKNTSKIKGVKRMTFGLRRENDFYPENIRYSSWGVAFDCRGESFQLKVPGEHNLQNALAAVAVGFVLGIDMKTIKKGLASFKGIKRRLELLGEKNGIQVVDDFAHNPDKVRASLSALKHQDNRMVVIFQPHGYGPTRFLREAMARAFSDSLREKDVLMCLPIYDAGGTADRNISSKDLLSKVKGPKCICPDSRAAAVLHVQKSVRPGDVCVVMGARDDTLRVFAGSILRAIK